MSLNLLLALSDSVSCTVLQDWLDLKSLVAVDSSFCNKSDRGFLMSLLRSDAFTLPKRSIVKKDGVDNYYVSWVIAREIPSQHFVVVGDADTSQLSNYLKQYGAKINSLALHHKYDLDVKLDPIITHCRNLIFLQINASKCDQQIRDLLLQNSNLVELHLSDDNDEMETEEESVYVNIKLPNLRVLSCSLASSTAFVDVLQMGNLIKLNVCEIQDENCDWSSIAQHCPMLRSLGLPHSIIDDATLTHIVRTCTHIVNLDLQGTHITDEGIRAVTTHLPNLRSLNIMSCNELTSVSLVHIYTQCADTLHTLHLNLAEEEGPVYEEDALNELFSKCTQLRTLRWGQSLEATEVYTLPESLHRLTTLFLCDSAGCDENLELVGQYCIHLTTFGIYRDDIYMMETDASRRSAETLIVVVVGCPQLRQLYYNEVSEGHGLYMNTCHVNWHKINPHLTIIDEYLKFDVFDMPV